MLEISEIPEVRVITPKIYVDDRGYFFESWNKNNYLEYGINCNWIQDNESKSSYGVLRGLHYQLPPYTQAKLVRVSKGKVLDVAVDIRQGSPTFGKYIAIELSDKNKEQLFIPRVFAHGFFVLSNYAIFTYKCDNKYAPDYEAGIYYNDLDINIKWPIDLSNCILSYKDSKNPTLKDAKVFDYFKKDYLL